MNRKLVMSSASTMRLASCHTDLIRVIGRVAKILNIKVLNGSRSIDNAAESGEFDSKALHRPSDQLEAAPIGLSFPRVPSCIAGLTEDDLRTFNTYIEQLTAWWYFGGVITGVSESLRLDDKLEASVKWAGPDGQMVRIERVLTPEGE